MKQKVLLVDAIINYILGILLIIYPTQLIRFLGIPEATHPFYPSVLGAVLCGIGLALIIEYQRTPSGAVGLGLAGAVAINICGALILAVLLLRGSLFMPVQGHLFLWLLVVVLVGISLVELLMYAKRRTKDAVKPEENTYVEE
jgi:hypothetical protein